jgi:hypothetical protein
MGSTQPAPAACAHATQVREMLAAVSARRESALAAAVGALGAQLAESERGVAEHAGAAEAAAAQCAQALEVRVLLLRAFACAGMRLGVVLSLQCLLCGLHAALECVAYGVLRPGGGLGHGYGCNAAWSTPWCVQ